MKHAQHQIAAMLAGIAHLNDFDLYDAWVDRVCPKWEIAEIVKPISINEFYISCNMSFSDIDVMLQDFAEYATNTDWMVSE